MQDDVILAKCESIERCIARIREVYERDKDALNCDFDVQDIVLLNLQRACQASIDLAMHLVRSMGIGIPKESADAFRLLKEAGVMDEESAKSMRAMTGFRNIAVHQYQVLEMNVVRNLIENHLSDFERFVETVLRRDASS